MSFFMRLPSLNDPTATLSSSRQKLSRWWHRHHARSQTQINENSSSNSNNDNEVTVSTPNSTIGEPIIRIHASGPDIPPERESHVTMYLVIISSRGEQPSLVLQVQGSSPDYAAHVHASPQGEAATGAVAAAAPSADAPTAATSQRFTTPSDDPGSPGINFDPRTALVYLGRPAAPLAAPLQRDRRPGD